MTVVCQLVHFDADRDLYADLDSSKEGMGGMVYHVKEIDTVDSHGTTAARSGYLPRSQIEPILFLSRKLTDAETRYWPTQLEIAGTVWVVRKIRHMIESAKQPPIVIYTDHGLILDIAKQSDITTSMSTTRTNLQLVRASKFLSRF